MKAKLAKAFAKIREALGKFCNAAITAIRGLPTIVKVACSVMAAMICSARWWWWTPLQRFATAHDKSFWIDVFLGTALLAIIPFALAAYGGQLAAETISDPVRQWRAKLKFWALCAVGVVLAFAQQYRASIQAGKSESKIDHAQIQIIGLLGDLHSSHGTMTEAERRRKILDSLREKYILSHDVDQSMIDGTGSPPADWVNDQLKSLGEAWGVNRELPTAPVQQARARTYLAMKGMPYFADQANFQVGQPLAFNVGFHVIGSNSISLGSMAMETILEPDMSEKSLEDAYNRFERDVAEDKKAQGGESKVKWRTLMPQDERFNTAWSWAPESTPGHRRVRAVTQTDLDNLKAGTEVAVVITELEYKDAGKLHHFWECSFLQPPAQAPGIWHEFSTCPAAD